MSDTYTSRLGLQQPQVNADAGAWGGYLNTDLQAIDDSISGAVGIDIAGLTTYTLTAEQGSEGADYQQRYASWVFFGTLTGNCTVTIASSQKIGWVSNQTSGGFNVILTAGGATLTIAPSSAWTLVYCDGTNILAPLGGGTSYLPLTGGTLSGALTISSGGLTITAGGMTINGGTTAFGANSVTGSNFTLTGGTIDGTPIGGSTPAAGAFTTLSATTALPVASGGTGDGTLATGQLLLGAGTSPVTTLAGTVAGQVPQWSGTAWAASTIPGQGNFAGERDFSTSTTMLTTDFGKLMVSTGGGTANYTFIAGSPGAAVGFLCTGSSSINLVHSGGFIGPFGGSSPINLPTGGMAWAWWSNTNSAWALAAAFQNGGGSGGGGGGGGGSCFLAWALVTMADGTEKPISLVRPGDWVMGRDGEANPVWALEPVILDDRPMIIVNEDHWTTEDHPYWTALGPCCFKPEELEKDWGHCHGVITHAGVETRLNVGLTREVGPLIKGAKLHWRDGLRQLETTEEVWLPPGTPLFNLVVGGSHTMRVDGYCVTAWPREDDFDYDLWRVRERVA